MFKIIALIAGVILIIVLITHILYFVIGESNFANKERNRGIHELILEGCNENTKIVEMELVGTPTSLAPQLRSEFVGHYDVLFTDVYGNKYIGYIINKELTRQFKVKKIDIKPNWKTFIVDKYPYFRLPFDEVKVNSSLGHILDTFEKLNKGYHVYRFNCHHKTQRLINLISGKEIHEYKCYGVSRVTWLVVKDFIGDFFRNLVQVKLAQD